MSNDWLPSNRQGVLEMAMKWNNVLAIKGQLWSVPEDKITELGNLTMVAQAAYIEANVKDRTSVLTAKVNEAFKQLIAAMRDIKKRYFYVPPLTPIDMVSLDLRMKDEIRTEVPDPVDTAKGSIKLSVRYILTVVWEIISTVAADPRSNHGVRINYGVQTDDPDAQSNLTGKYYYLTGQPHSPEQLAYDIFTRRKKHVIEFPQEDSGKTAWFCLRVENSKGGKGPWGEMFSAVIP